MKIVQLITRPQRRGAEIFAVQLAERLRILGHEVVLISLFQGPGGLEFSGKWIKLDLVPTGKLDWKGFRQLAKILDQISPDLVQCNASDTLRYGALAKWFSRSPFKLIYRNANQMSHFLDSTLKKWWNALLIRQVDGVASVSELSKVDFLKTFPFKRKIEVLPVGIDLEELDSKSSQPLPIEISKPYFINLGGWVKEKNQQDLLQIFGKLRQSIKHSPCLLLVGKGPEKSALQELTQTLKIGDSVHFVPSQSNPFSILKHAKALVLTPNAEGLPAVILEAMYLGIPVIAYDVGGISELIQTGKTGWLVPKGDQKGFHDALLECLDMPDNELRKITNSAKFLMETRYELSGIAMAFENFYKKLIKDQSF